MLRLAITADAVHFQRFLAGLKAEAVRLDLDELGDAWVAHFNRVVAYIADQERHLMGFSRVLAIHKRVDRLQFVDKSILQQEVQGAVDRRRCNVVVSIAHAFEQIVGFDWRARRGNQFQHFTAQRRQAQLALRARVLDFAYKGRSIVLMVMQFVAACVHVEHCNAMGLRWRG